MQGVIALTGRKTARESGSFGIGRHRLSLMLESGGQPLDRIFRPRETDCGVREHHSGIQKCILRFRFEIEGDRRIRRESAEAAAKTTRENRRQMLLAKRRRDALS